MGAVVFWTMLGLANAMADEAAPAAAVGDEMPREEAVVAV
jgi:hypothetical protein